MRPRTYCGVETMPFTFRFRMPSVHSWPTCISYSGHFSSSKARNYRHEPATQTQGATAPKHLGRLSLIWAHWAGVVLVGKSQSNPSPWEQGNTPWGQGRPVGGKAGQGQQESFSLIPDLDLVRFELLDCICRLYIHYVCCHR